MTWDFIRRERAAPNLVLANVERAQFASARLVSAELNGASGSDCNQHGAELHDAKLDNANLPRANLQYANLTRASLVGSKLPGANFVQASLREAFLRDADLTGSSFFDTDFAETRFLGRVRLDGSSIGDCLLVNVGVTPFCEADGLKFTRESSIDYRSILRAASAPNLTFFLRGIGMPELLIEANVTVAQLLTPGERDSMLQSTFISYGGPDEEFATKLRDALRKQKVKTFFFKDDAVPGVKLPRVMHKGVREHDRVILVCSKSSLTRPGVLYEIDQAISREAEDGASECIIPITLDDYVFKHWTPKNPQVATEIRNRVIADFSNPNEFTNNVGKLIRALKKTVP